MPLLLYCVAEAAIGHDTQTGVAGLPVERMESSGISVSYSRNSTADAWLKTPVKNAAREFHKVQQKMFDSLPIVPFRFPTTFEDEERLRQHLNEHAAEYHELLRRFATCVQIDIALSQSASPPAESGTQFLRDRQNRVQTLERVAGQLHVATQPVIRDWRLRSTSSSLRCFALLERRHVGEFNERIKATALADGITARVSGPWPVAEFLDLTEPDVARADIEKPNAGKNP
jgi:Gas vesicle synthesis protein GvpL/GvpF